jgi:ATP-dependent exoDNAse (exonuclease V) alpha subunit
VFLKADQIICGLNKTRNSLNAEIRSYKGISPDEILPVEGEKVICTLNDWEKALDENGDFYLVNGIIGFAQNVKEGYDKIATMEFRADFLDNSVTSAFDVGIFTNGKYAHGYGDRAVFLADGSVVHEDDYARLFRKKAVDDVVIDRFEFAYAITCHKSQGSEFDFVVVFDESWAFQEERNKWLYTAITRAKQKLLIIR